MTILKIRNQPQKGEMTWAQGYTDDGAGIRVQVCAYQASLLYYAALAPQSP